MLWWKMFVPCQNRVPLKKSISSNLPQQIPMLLWKMFVFLPKTVSHNKNVLVWDSFGRRCNFEAAAWHQ